ncbi:UNVERIFIED_CONTAM: Disease resistance protein RGA2 [Sesamum latifolium]|uniref:Disease resistance protein RGA2 n=1 Tax=Sesamum latifolium TaxID=2727402 RepID=A0AAW2VFP0_9LAMI
MAETFLFNITDRVLGRFSSIALEHITSAFNTKSEVQKLQSTLSTIKAVILDADGQQAKNHEVRDWLEKLKDAVYEIDDLLDDLSTQVFTEECGDLQWDFDPKKVDNNVKEQTHSFVRASDIIGGLGKTTVVKLAYNDDRVVQSFDLGMWVSVSEDFGVGKVVEKILRSATGESFAHLDMDQMQSHLADVLNDKKYLLVLDDVWNEDSNKWMDLKELLMNGRAGSKIIVTTRSKAVALITGTTSPYNLADEKEWLRIKDNDIWEIDQKQSDILPILRLSYEKLPPDLRQCFAYCSMLPKGLEIPREAFINLWIAQGFVRSASRNRELEDIGNQYFNQLLSRFCFQEVVEAFDGEILACKIHSLVHDLAQSVAGDECLNVKSDTKNISDRVRHLYLHDEDLSEKEAPKTLLKSKNLRSFRCTYKNKPSDKTFIQGIAMKFRRLRVLVLQALDLEELPSSIGGLQQLRFSWKLQKFSQHQNLVFDLPGDISDKEKTTKLQFSLQFMLLYNCDFVQLPSEGFQNLNSLRVLLLDLSEGDGLEGLTSLESLLLMGLPKLINLPLGLTKNVAKTLKFFRIANCANFAMLPVWLLNFNLLQRLYVEDCPNLSFLPQVRSHIAKVHVTGCPKLHMA